MLKPCQHTLAFSSLHWYSVALKAVLPTSRHFIKKQYRASATLTSVLEEDDIPSTFVTPRSFKPLQSLDRLPLETKKKKAIRKGKTKQCTGFRSVDGQRCQRRVALHSALLSTDNILCFDHDPHVITKKRGRKKLNTEGEKRTLFHETLEKGVPLTKKSRILTAAASKIYDCWHLWIGEDIPEKHAKLMRKEIEKPISDYDKPGFIYAYSLSQGQRESQDSYAYFKIGRTKDPHRRMYQVSKQCKMIPKIIELFPSFPIHQNQRVASTNLRMLHTELDQIPKCPLSHRVERLIHLELSSIHKPAEFKCAECGTLHREWICVKRKQHENGKVMTDQQLWLSSVRPVILKWVQFGVVASAMSQAYQTQ